MSRIEVLHDGHGFIEYTKDGYPAEFTITVCEPYKRYGFDMENSNMKGHWTGVFSYENGITRIEFTEDAAPKKIIKKPFVGMYLKKQQQSYIADLKKRLEEL